MSAPGSETTSPVGCGSAATSAGEIVAREWRARTAAEYSSAVATQQVTLWMMLVGAAPDLIRDGLRIVEDELVHSELSAEVVAAAGGTDGPPVLDPRYLTLDATGDRFTDLLDATLRIFCIGETVAVPLFRMLRQCCAVPVARETLDRVLHDEVRHRQFGWDVLDWFMTTDGPTTVAMADRRLPAMLDDLVSAYSASTGGLSSEADVTADARAWGLAPQSDYVAVLATALAKDVVGRFRVRGIDPALGPAATILLGEARKGASR